MGQNKNSSLKKNSEPPNEKPVSLHPLLFEEALKKIVRVKVVSKEEKKEDKKD